MIEERPDDLPPLLMLNDDMHLVLEELKYVSEHGPRPKPKAAAKDAAGPEACARAAGVSLPYLSIPIHR